MAVVEGVTGLFDGRAGKTEDGSTTQVRLKKQRYWTKLEPNKKVELEKHE